MPQTPDTTATALLKWVAGISGSIVAVGILWIGSQIIHLRDDIAQVNGRLGTMEVKMETTYARVDAITAVESRVDVLEALQDAP